MARITIETAEDIPEGYLPVASSVVMKCLDPSGVPTLVIRNSTDLTVWDAVGMLVTAGDMARSEAKSCFLPLFEDEE